MKVRELKKRLQDITEMGFGDFEVVINTIDEEGRISIFSVDGFVDRLHPQRRLRLFSDKEGNITKNPW